MPLAGAKKSKTGRPQVDSEAVNIRLERPALQGLDAWRKQQPDLPTRPEAIRRLLEKALASPAKGTPMSDPDNFVPIEDVTSENDE
jgi:hypothetical protein